MGILRECPFCGNKNLTIYGGYKIDHGNGEYIKPYTVICDILKGGCGASSGYRETKVQAIKAWNMRASNIKEDSA